MTQRVRIESEVRQATDWLAFRNLLVDVLVASGFTAAPPAIYSAFDADLFGDPRGMVDLVVGAAGITDANALRHLYSAASTQVAGDPAFLRMLLTELNGLSSAPAPLSLNARVIYDGDSHTAGGIGAVGGGGTGDVEYRQSWAVFAQDAALNPGYRPVGYNLGVAGQQMVSQIYPRRASTWALAPALVVLSGGGNDFANNVSAAAVLASVEAYIAEGLLNGVQFFVICTVPQRFAGNAFTTPQNTERLTYNAALLALASNPRIKVADLASVITSAGDTVDNVHLNLIGMTKDATVTGPAIAACFGGASGALNMTQANGYAKSMAGTGGSKTGTDGVDVAGSVATGWTLRGNTGGGALITGSKDAVDDKQIIDLSGAKTTTARNFQLFYTEAVGGIGFSLAAGDTIEGFLDFEVLETLLNVSSITCELVVTSADFLSTFMRLRGGGQQFSLDAAIPIGRYVNRTPAGVIRAGTVGQVYPTCSIKLVDGSVSVDGKIKIHAMGVRKVA